MKYNKFDNHAKDIIGSHETPINTEALWENVHAELHPKKKKKFAWIWFSASSVLAVILFSGYMYYTADTNVIIEEKAVVESTNEISTKKKQQKVIPAEKTTKSEIVETVSSRKKENTTKSNIVKTQKSKIKREVKSSNKNPIRSAKMIAANTQVQNNSTRNLKQTSKTKIETSKSTDATSKNIPVEEMKNSSSTTPTIKANTDGPQKIKAIEKNEKTDIKEPTQIIAENEIEDEVEVAETIKEEEETEDITEAAAEEASESLSRKLKRNFQLGFGFRAGISNSLTTLTAKSDNSEQLRSIRSESESNLETIDLGLDVFVKHKSGLYFNTGLDYLKASRKLEFNDEVTSFDSVLGISKIYVNPITMDTTYEEGLIERTTTSFRNKEVYNNLHLINIPFNLGYSLNYEQWTFGIQGGALLNVVLERKGEIMDSTSSFYDLKVDESNWFKENLGLSFQGAALIGYNFSDNFQIVGGPSFRSSLLLSNDANPIEQSQVGLGLQVSARYWLD